MRSTSTVTGPAAGVVVFAAGGEASRPQPNVPIGSSIAHKDDAKRVAYDTFFAYHRIARALYLINLGLGMTLLCVKVQKWVR